MAKNEWEIQMISYGDWFRMRWEDLSAWKPGTHLSIGGGDRSKSRSNGSGRSLDGRSPIQGNNRSRSKSKGPTGRNLGVNAPTGNSRSRSKSKETGGQRRWN